MKILITGANGYIGSKIVTKLLDFGNDVIATDFDNSHIDERAKFVKANIFDESDFWEKFEHPDVCLHLAWRDGFFHNSPSHFIDLSSHFKFLTGLIDKGLKCLAVMGSMHEIGYHEGVVGESTPSNPKSLYGIAKYSLREALISYTKDKNIIFQWLRAYYIYGDDLYGNSIFCKIKNAAMNGEKSFPFTNGKNKFDFLSIDELTTQIANAVTQKTVNGIIEICSGNPLSLSEKIEWYINENNLDISLEYGKFKERENESPCIYGDVRKINLISQMKNKKILVTGVGGQLGYDCVRVLKSRGYTNVIAVDICDLDIANESSVYKFIGESNPDVVIHCAAWTAVDKAELNPERVYNVNSLGTKYIATVCKKINAKLVYISTDYVFSGEGIEPFEIDSPKKGLSIYGKTKSQGEDYVMKIMESYFIVRTTGAFGVNGNNFVKTMIKLSKSSKKEINVVSDQIVSVTYTLDLAELICDMIETEKYGIYHATNEGFISWSEFAREIFKQIGSEMVVNDVSTVEYTKMIPNQAKRPLNSRLSKSALEKAGFYRLPEWKDALKRYLLEIKEK